MAQEDHNRLAEWYEIVRTQVPLVRERFETWLAAVREQPVLIWETPPIRYAVYGLGVIILLWSVSYTAHLLTPAPPVGARPTATTADYHVICTARDCGTHFVARRRFGFHKFPLVCPKCHKKTGMQARLCHSKTCGGRWVLPEKRDGTLRCPRCGTAFP